jgi:sugar lactone lactonase YvrE
VQGGPLLYSENGAVQHTPTVHLILWGKNLKAVSEGGTKTGEEVQTILKEYFGALSKSAYQGILTQYFDPASRVAPEINFPEPYVYTETEGESAPQSVERTKLEHAINRAIEINKWPIDINTQFVLVTAPGSTYEAGFMEGFCAYHEFTSTKIVYDFIPYQGDPQFSGCVSGDVQGNSVHKTSKSVSHEYSEAATDPEASCVGWRTVGCGEEIGDLCSFNGDRELPGSHAWAQGEYDDHLSGCTYSDPTPPHVLGLTEGPVTVAQTGATLGATVNAESEGGPSYHFKYWSNPSEPHETGSVSFEADRKNHLVTQAVSGLKRGLTYHYRVVATDSSGTTEGEEQSFPTGQWSLGELPSPTGSVATALFGASCVSSEWCAAVGISQQPYAPLAEVWNGKEGRWAAQSAQVPGAQEAHLSGVSCTSTTACTAVGEYALVGATPATPLAERWNGTAWSIQTVPHPSGATETALSGVSCSSASECMAVGWTKSSSGTISPFAALWANGTWTERTPESPVEGGAVTALSGVSCSSGSFCLAVGRTKGESSSEAGFAERWSGSGWKIVSPPTPAGAEHAALAGVSCTSLAACTAVGRYTGTHGGSSEAYRGSWIERWNGEAQGWSEQAYQRPGASRDELTSVSCATPESCTAAGKYYETTKGYPVALVEQWNGASWSVQPTPTDPGSYPNVLLGVSCAVESTCATVGYNYIAPWGHQLAFTRSETSMAVQATPMEGGSTHGVLAGASCTSSTACTEVGSYANGSGTVSLADAWNGIEWATQPTPGPSGAKATELHRVSCTGPSACTAVGSYTNSSGAIVTLAERFDGTKWIPESPPNPNGAKESRLSGVSCTSASSCTAVGFYKNGGGSPFLSFAESWNGKEWKIQTTENPLGATKVELLGVSCSATGACTAVGTYTNSTSETLGLAERLSGTEWKIQGTSNPSGGKSVELSGVSCPSASACTAVGSYTNGSGNPVSLAEGWNGTEWQMQAMQSPAGTVQSKTLGVSCTALGACTAVGWSKQSSGSATPLAELWNGREWLPWSAPSPSSEGGELLDVSCVSMYACESAGTYMNSSKVQVSLAEGLGAPGVKTGQATSVTQTSATVSGSVKPNITWLPTTYRFEYGTSTSYGRSAPVPDAMLSSESSEEEVHTVLQIPPGPATTYHFRLVASNAAGTTYGKDQTFTRVAVPPPGVSTGPATNVTPTNATLTGTVTPNSWPTTYHFEYGPTTSYGTSVPVPDASLKSETTAEEVSRTIVVAPATTYHFRLVASHTGATETVSGEDRTFTTQTAPAPSFTSSFGSLGTGGGQFNYAAGVAVDSTGNVWVTDSVNNRVQEFSPAGAFMMTFGFGVKDGKEVEETCTSTESCQAGLPGSGEGQFHSPGGIAVEKASGNLWVGDAGNGRLEEFSSKGKYLASVKTLPYNWGVAVDSSGDVWVTTAGYGYVQEFSSSPPPLHEVRQFYGSGTVTGVAADAQGNIWVVNENHNRVDEYTPEGNFMRTFGWGVLDGHPEAETCTSNCQAGIPGSGPGQMDLPAGVAVDEKGILWVTVNNSVEEFTPTGEYITKFGSGGSGPEQFNGPLGPAVGGGWAYVADSRNNRVQKWAVSE